MGSLTTIYVEQVIIGFTFLMTAAVFVTGRLPRLDGQGLVAGAIAVGASYVAGIFWDRCSDTLLERLERWRRLTFAIRDQYEIRADPFPQFSDKLKSWDDVPYLQSRIRILRSMTTLVPLMTLAAVVQAARLPPEIRGLLLAATALLVLIVPLMSTRLPKVPRTNELDAVRALMPRKKALFHADYEPVLVALALLAIEAIAVGAMSKHRLLAMATAVAGMALTLAVGWAWLRIYTTYLAYLRDHGKA